MTKHAKGCNYKLINQVSSSLWTWGKAVVRDIEAETFIIKKRTIYRKHYFQRKKIINKKMEWLKCNAQETVVLNNY